MPDIKNSKPGKFDADAAIAFLRRAFPAATAQNVSAVTGIPASTVDKWLRGISAPDSDNLCILAAAFGPRFLAAAMPVARPWLEAETVRHELETAIDRLNGTIRKVRRLAGTAA